MPHDIWSAGGSLEAMLESGGAAGARHPYALRGGAATSRRRMPLKGTYSTYPASNHGVAAGCENYGVGDRRVRSGNVGDLGDPGQHGGAGD